MLTLPASFSLGTAGSKARANPFHSCLEEGHPAHPRRAVRCRLRPAGPSSPECFPRAVACPPPLLH